MNGQQFAQVGPDGNIYIVTASSLAVYDSNMNLAGSVELPSNVLPTCLVFTTKKVVVGLYEYGDATKPAYQVIDLASHDITYGYLASKGSVSNQTLTTSFSQGGCAAFPNEKVLFGDAFETGGFSGTPQGFPKLALVDLGSGEVSYGSTNTTFAVVSVYAVPNSTKSLVLFDAGPGGPNYFEVVDTSNMSQALTPIYIGFTVNTGVIFLNGTAYVSGNGKSATIDLTSGQIITSTQYTTCVGAQSDGDPTYVECSLSNSVAWVSTSAPHRFIAPSNNWYGYGVETLLSVARGTTSNNDVFTMSTSNPTGILIATVARPSPAIGAVVNAFSQQAGATTPSTIATVAPGDWVVLYGTNLAAAAFPATTYPFPTLLNGTTPWLQCAGSNPLALQSNYVGPGQINVYLPAGLNPLACPVATLWETTTFPDGTSVSAPPVQVTVTPTAPGILQNLTTGFADVVHLDGMVNGSGMPGDTIILFGAGFGQTVPCGTLQCTATMPSLLINNQPAEVLFSGLTPGFTGLYQMNVVIPSNIGIGSQNITAKMGNGPSTQAKISIGVPQ